MQFIFFSHPSETILCSFTFSYRTDTLHKICFSGLLNWNRRLTPRWPCSMVNFEPVFLVYAILLLRLREGRIKLLSIRLCYRFEIIILICSGIVTSLVWVLFIVDAFVILDVEDGAINLSKPISSKNTLKCFFKEMIFYLCSIPIFILYQAFAYWIEKFL